MWLFNNFSSLSKFESPWIFPFYNVSGWHKIISECFVNHTKLWRVHWTLCFIVYTVYISQQISYSLTEQVILDLSFIRCIFPNAIPHKLSCFQTPPWHRIIMVKIINNLLCIEYLHTSIIETRKCLWTVIFSVILHDENDARDAAKVSQENKKWYV